MNLHGHDVRATPPQDFNFGDYTRSDTVADQIGEPLFQVERFNHTAHISTSVPDTDQ